MGAGFYFPGTDRVPETTQPARGGLSLAVLREDREGTAERRRQAYAMFLFTNSQLTRFQNASTNLARALR